MEKLTDIEILRALLVRDRVSFTDLARTLETTPQNISQILKRKDISINRLRQIAAAAGYDVVIEFQKKAPENT